MMKFRFFSSVVLSRPPHLPHYYGKLFFFFAVTTSEVMTIIIYIRLYDKCVDLEDSHLKFIQYFSPKIQSKCPITNSKIGMGESYD